MLVFLVAVLLVGSAISLYRRRREQVQLERISIVLTADSLLRARRDTAAGVDSGASAPVLLDINTATAAELDLLPGIGPALSQRIIDYRKQTGGFRTREDLLKVSGIGPKKYGAIRDLITVSPH